MRRPPLLLALFVLLATGCAAPRDAAAPEPRPDLLVSADWLTDRLDEVVVLHVGPDRTAYDRGHVPGARFLPLAAVAADRGDQVNVLPPVRDAEAAVRAAGVSDGDHVVLYGDMNGLAATRAFFALDVLGHPRVAVLDGGLAAWRAAGGTVATDAGAVEPGTFTARLRSDLVVDAAEVEALRERGDAVLVDARPPDQHAGTEPGEGIERPGHIPGSVSLFWEGDTREDGTLRPLDELRARYAGAGVVPGREVVAYCRTGVQASHAYFVTRLLGFAPRLYDGSFHDWSNNTDYPVATGS